MVGKVGDPVEIQADTGRRCQHRTSGLNTHYWFFIISSELLWHSSLVHNGTGLNKDSRSKCLHHESRHSHLSQLQLFQLFKLEVYFFEFLVWKCMYKCMWVPKITFTWGFSKATGSGRSFVMPGGHHKHCKNFMQVERVWPPLLLVIAHKHPLSTRTHGMARMGGIE